ncbi:MAG: Asp-tRNA(Asn)/Glu-tRNA(Gln) amidotransferase subunit GatB [Candidatus Omnitrophica bacterium]|nr:Asp-tRNA(Asn)/Glu-tRNA(Gln) amidotransferase subunit GatB [Candidatus Omnitrophota bacterium]
MYETVIGLEVHVQLNTASKMFCGCAARFGAEPNTQVCQVCLGFPGVLPVINKKAVMLAIKTALALDCEIAGFTKFDRKHYFYPDLPKNFQISQYDKPLSRNGFLEIEAGGSGKRVGLTRIHLEEDAGKLIHSDSGDFSLVDYNRTGIPLLEIVTEPDMRSPEEAYEFLSALKEILLYLEVSNCNMEEGSLRCDANISVRPLGQKTLGTKTEVKNMNSFKGVRQALQFEADRQVEMLKNAQAIAQETRLWDSELEKTDSMRTKEEAHDYRYFPEPDLLPIVPSQTLVDEIRKTLPEMPRQRKERFAKDYKLSEYDSAVLTRDKPTADFFEETVRQFDKPKVVANWVTGDMAAVLSSAALTISAISFKPADLADMLSMIESGAISGKMAKDLLRESIEKKKRPSDIVREKGLSQVTDEGVIAAVVEKVLAANPRPVLDYKSGNASALTFLVGQVMKETKGKANPRLVNELLKKRLI